jgi:hypothetical protein
MARIIAVEETYSLTMMAMSVAVQYMRPTLRQWWPGRWLLMETYPLTIEVRMVGVYETYPPTMEARMVAMTRTRAATIPLEAMSEIWTQLQLRVKSKM